MMSIFFTSMHFYFWCFSPRTEKNNYARKCSKILSGRLEKFFNEAKNLFFYLQL
jgi:hypothetical protein